MASLPPVVLFVSPPLAVTGQRLTLNCLSQKLLERDAVAGREAFWTTALTARPSPGRTAPAWGKWTRRKQRVLCWPIKWQSVALMAFHPAM